MRGCMELKQLIETYKAASPTDVTLSKLLGEIEKLEAKRQENLFALHEKVAQFARRLHLADNDVPADLQQWVQGYQAVLMTALTEQREQFGIALEEGLAPLGIKLRGQYPKLYGGLFTFNLKFDKGRCEIWYGPEQERLSDMALDAGKVAESIGKLQGALGSDLAVDRLMTKLQQAYRHARLDHATPAVPLLALLPYMALLIQSDSFSQNPRKESYRSYSRADFSYDLHRVNMAEPNFRLIIATRQQTQSHGHFLWVPTREDVESGNYFAMIEMKEEN
jgi:hypothetical protein